jgi:hypothetical protein
LCSFYYLPSFPVAYPAHPEANPVHPVAYPSGPEAYGVRSTSVVDPNPDPDPPDPHVFGPPGFGTISQRDGSGSGSFYHQAIKVKNLDSYCFVTSFLLFIFENDVHVPSDPSPDLDPLVRGMDPLIQIRFWIHPKMSWIRNTAFYYLPSFPVAFPSHPILQPILFTL